MIRGVSNLIYLSVFIESISSATLLFPFTLVILPRCCHFSLPDCDSGFNTMLVLLFTNTLFSVLSCRVLWCSLELLPLILFTSNSARMDSFHIPSKYQVNRMGITGLVVNGLTIEHILLISMVQRARQNFDLLSCQPSVIRTESPSFWHR